MRPIVQINLMGGLGNCLFQYACAKKYCLLHDAVLESPDWVGCKIFDLQDPFWSCDLPERNDGGSVAPQPIQWGEVNIRLGGYFQFQDWVKILSRRELKEWFKIAECWLSCIPKKQDNYAAAHIRRGDYVNHPLFCTIKEEAYLEACKKYHIESDKLVWVRQDQPQLVPGLPSDISYLADFVTLMNATTILRANSTFSWWAATLSDAKVYSPIVEDLVGEHIVPFVEGNHPKCTHTNRVGVKITDLFLPE